MKHLLLTGAAAAVALFAAGAAGAQTLDYQPKAAGHWIVDLRVTDVSPETNDAVVTASGAATGLHVKVTDSVVPTLGFSYFITDHIAVEAILGTSNHAIHAVGGGTDLKVYKTWVLPPVVALQYHFMPKARFSPYVGGGVNAMFFYDGKGENNMSVRLKNGVGGALQAGADYAIAGPWVANFDVKQIFFNTDAKINGGALKSSVDLNPLVISLGVGRKF
jgi:outer membrane protein